MPGYEHLDLPAVDPVVPNQARMYAIGLGDPSWAYPSDHEAFEHFAAAEPLAEVFARENRDFITRAVAWAGNRGITQYLDLGAGLPVATYKAVHEIALASVPDDVTGQVQVVYVDNDPVAYQGLTSVISGIAGVSTLWADLTDPAQVLRAAQEAGIDPSEPVCVLLGLVLHFLLPDQARMVVARYCELIAPGSCVVVSVARADGDTGPRLQRAYRAATHTNPSREEVTSWLMGLDLVEPGMTEARAWRPDQPASPDHAPRAAQVWCGVGSKPVPAGTMPPAAGLSPLHAPVPGPPPAHAWQDAYRLMDLLGKDRWTKIVLLNLPDGPPGIRPSELRERINEAAEAHGGLLSLKILLECLGRMTAHGPGDRPLAGRAELPRSHARRVTLYWLTEDGKDARAALRRLVGAPDIEQARPAATPALPPLDVSKPSIARVYDVLLGGKDNFRVDREFAAQMLRVLPLNAELARESRAFLLRAVEYVAEQGIGQFLDLGAGLPTSPAVHEVARRRNPAARVLYVDNDAMVVLHAAALLPDEGVAAAAGDINDPAAVLNTASQTGLIDLRRPVCVILSMVLHFVTPQQAAWIVRRFTRALAPGSYVIMSVGTSPDQDLASRYVSTYTAGNAGSFYYHNTDQIIGYFIGLDLVEPGVTESRYWQVPRPETTAERPAEILAGVGRITS